MDWGELGKSKIKGNTIVFCKDLVPKRRCFRGLLSNLAQHVKSKAIGPYQNTFSEIAGIDRGAQVLARVQWVEESETNLVSLFLSGD